MTALGTVALQAAAMGAATLGTSVALTYAPGCGDEARTCAPASLAPPARTAAYAVVTSDYAVTAVALLDAEGALVDEAFVDSGSTSAGLVATLSGDVVFPTAPVGVGRMLLLDRYPADVLTYLHLDGSTPPLQAVARADDASRGWSANPHDALVLADARWLVTRFEPNLLPDAAPLDRGDDLAFVDPTVGRVVGRIDLSALGTTEGDDAAIPARPDRIARLDTGRVVVGLARLSFDFRVTGSGAVAVVDLARAEATPIALPGLRFCGDVRPLPGPDRTGAEPSGRVVVLCQGRTWATEAERAMEAGLVALRAEPDGAVVVESVWRATEGGAPGSPTALVAALDETHVVVAAYGEVMPGAPPTTDRLFVVDLRAAATEPVYTSPLRFALAAGAYDPVRRLLLVPEGELGVLRIDVDASGHLAVRDHVDPSPCRGLPARQVAALQ